MTRFEKSEIVAQLIVEFFKEKGETPWFEADHFIRSGLFIMKSTSKEYLKEVVRWLWKNHRKEYYFLCGCCRDESKKQIGIILYHIFCILCITNQKNDYF